MEKPIIFPWLDMKIVFLEQDNFPCNQTEAKKAQRAVAHWAKEPTQKRGEKVHFPAHSFCHFL